MPRRIARQGSTGILYEDTRLHHPDPALLEARHWAGAPAAPGYSGGRGQTLFVEHEGQRWVLRHYHRGGTIGRFLDDQFLWTGEQRTRCFREWEMLAHLAELRLPAPRPVAAAYRRRGLVYTADLLTELIPDVEPLSSRLARGAADQSVWTAVGQCVARFHRAGVWHADLTAHNLQISGGDEIFLLDFDRGRLRSANRGWQEANLARLHRSLTKISEEGSVAFGRRDWEWLLAGYHAAIGMDPDTAPAGP